MQTTICENTKPINIGGFQSLKRLLTPGPTLQFHSAASNKRDAVENYIADQFNRIYGANIRDFMPLFLSMTCQTSLITAVGLRPAHQQSLFLEQYLPRPIETFVSTVAGNTVNRNQITEIGNLVATQRGAIQLLFLMLTAVLQRTHFEWVVFTATPQVHKMMTRMGMQLHELYEADPTLLKRSHISEWGSYYDSRPKVVTVNVNDAMDCLLQRSGYRNAISLYQSRIQTLATMMNNQSNGDDQHTFSA
jgi:hypothetical protein